MQESNVVEVGPVSVVAGGEPVLPPVVAGSKRVLSFDVRCQVVRFYDGLPTDGSKGSFLRRHGLYKSSIRQWRIDMHHGAAQVKAGRKPVDAGGKEMIRLRAENARLTAELEKASIVIDVQKKVSRLLEMHMAPMGHTS